MKRIAVKVICLSTFLAGSLPLVANPSTVESLRKELSGVRSLELPSRAASLVAAAKAADREALAADIIRAGVEVNAASTPMLVGAVSRANPAVAAQSAGTAASLQPKQLAQITRSAVSAAPSEVEHIVTALCKAQPTSFYIVGISAADIAISPKAGEAILRGISAASPALSSLIVRATGDVGPAKNAATFGAVLKRADALLAGLSKTMKATPEAILSGNVTSEMSSKLTSVAASLPPQAPPTVGGPFTTPSSTPPLELSTSDAYVAPPGGGRTYSAP